MNNKIISLLFIFASLSASAQYKSLQSTQNFRKDVNISEGHRLFQKSGPIRDEETGLISSEVLDQSLTMINFSFMTHHNPTEITSIMALDGKLALHWKENIYWSGFLYAGTHQFDAISEITTSLSANPAAVNSENSMLIAGGIGAGITSNYFADVFGSDNMFETLTGQIGLASFSENIFKETYIGPGFRGEFGLHWRLTQHNHLGLKFLWNNYTVIREARNGTESESDRHLSLSWLSIGLDWGIYF